MTTEPWTGEIPTGWTGGDPVTKWWRGSYVHLYRLRKPCAQCAAEMTIDVTAAALNGTAKNAGLRLQRCGECRHKSKHGEGGSRPRVADQPTTPGAVNGGELETLRMANAVMKQELDGLYGTVAELRGRLAQYELQPAMEALGGSQSRPLTFPWETT